MRGAYTRYKTMFTVALLTVTTIVGIGLHTTVLKKAKSDMCKTHCATRKLVF